MDRIYRELLGAGQEPPEIGDAPGRVRVAFVGRAPRRELVGLFNEYPGTLDRDLDAQLALFTLLSTRTITAARLAPIIQKGENEARDSLERLADERIGVLEQTATNASRMSRAYRLKSTALTRLGRAVSYHRQDPGDLEEKVLRHLRDYGEINNRTLQDFFDIDVQRARTLLTRLRRRKLIEKLDGPSRGSRVKYGPGPGLSSTR